MLLEPDCGGGVQLARDDEGWMLLLDVGGRALLELGHDLDLGGDATRLEHELLDCDHVLLELDCGVLIIFSREIGVREKMCGIT